MQCCQVEQFPNLSKLNPVIMAFTGTGKNAVMIQIQVALYACLKLSLIKSRPARGKACRSPFSC
jgi:hypothetical protein